MKIVFTQHAIDRMSQRGIERNTVIETLNNPDIEKVSYNYIECIKIYNKTKRLKVIYKKAVNKIVIITSFWF